MRSSDATISLIVREEIGSPEFYQSNFQSPDWPGGESGVTIGVGYDCGYSNAAGIHADWGGRLPSNMVTALISVAGIHGSPAHALAHELHFVIVPLGTAMDVFKNRDMPKWEAIVARSLANTDKLSADSFGALVSLAYNRGASFHMAGDRYREMRQIADHMVSGQLAGIPDIIRSMSRLWPTMRGLRDRRDHEAALFAQGLA